MKIKEDGELAAAVAGYVDDFRIVAGDENTVWKFAKKLCWLGIQDMASKRQKPSKHPGAWAGAMVQSYGEVVTKGVGKERWDKVWLRIPWLACHVGLEVDVPDCKLNITVQLKTKPRKGCIHFKTTKSIVGFLVYVGMTYKSLMSDLKDLYLSLNSWRKNRDNKWWKMLGKRKRETLTKEDLETTLPDWVETVPRLQDDLEALMKLTSTIQEPQIPVRPGSSAVLYVVGNASGAGFGSMSWKSSESKIRATVGLWNDKTTKGLLTYFREAANLVLKLKFMLEKGELVRYSEVFIFTDNFVFEWTFYKGSSNSKLLHDVIVDLISLEMRGDLIVHAIWISWKRMIAQGSNGLSRCNNSSRVMAGKSFLNYIPLNETAFKISSTANSTILEQWLDKSWKLANYVDWFYSVFYKPKGKWVWCPPLALAKVAVEQLCEVKLVFPKS